MRRLVPLLVVLLAGCSAILDWKDKEPTDAITEDSVVDSATDLEVLDTDDAEAPADAETDEIPCDEAGPRLSDQRITDLIDASSSPSMAWTGSTYGLAWQTDMGGTADIYFAIMDEDGGPITYNYGVTNDTVDSTSVSLVWTGSQFGLSWSNVADGNNEIFFARIDTTPAKIGGDVRITEFPGSSTSPSLAWNGGGFGVTWSDDMGGIRQIYFAQLSSTGAKMSSDVEISTATSGLASLPSIAWSGSEFGLVWQQDEAELHDVYFVRVSMAGTRMMPSDLAVASQPGNSESPSIVWAGSVYGVSWHDGRNGPYDIYFARVSGSGTSLEGDVRITDNVTNSSYSSLAWTGIEYGVSWHDDRYGDSEVMFARISSSGEKQGSDVRITNELGMSMFASLVWAGSEFGVGWQDYRGGYPLGIYFNVIAYCP